MACVPRGLVAQFNSSHGLVVQVVADNFDTHNSATD
jgi:hypothetical protein